GRPDADVSQRADRGKNRPRHTGASAGGWGSRLRDPLAGKRRVLKRAPRAGAALTRAVLRPKDQAILALHHRDRTGHERARGRAYAYIPKRPAPPGSRAGIGTGLPGRGLLPGQVAPMHPPRPGGTLAGLGEHTRILLHGDQPGARVDVLLLPLRAPRD